MPDLLLEFLSEEIPARMQARAAEDLRKLVTDRLVAAGLVYEGAKALRDAAASCAYQCMAFPHASPTSRKKKKAHASAHRKTRLRDF